MMENSNDFIFFKDRNHVFTGASQTLVSVTDPSQHWTDLIGQTDYDVFAEEYADVYYRLEKQVFAGMAVAQEIQQYQTKDGLKGWIDNRKHPIRNAQGEITGLFGIARVITDRVVAEQALQQERDSTRTILATVEAMIVALDTEGRITLVNRKGCQILGYREEELIGKDWFTTCLPRSIDVDLVREVFKMSLAGNLCGAEYFENPVLTRAGEERLIAWHNSTIHDKNGHIIGGLSAGEDITERKKTEVHLRENEQLLHAVLDQIPDPVVLKDRNGDFLLCNQAVARLYNTTPEAMVGKQDGDFGVPREMADLFRDNVLTIMAKGETEIVYEDSQDSVTGAIHHYRSIKKPFKDGLGQDQILVIAQDITDVVLAQEKIAVSEKRLQEVLTITNEGVWDWHISSGKVIHNRQWFKLLGAAPGDIDETLEAFAKLIHPEDLETVQKLLSAMLDGSSVDYHSKHRMVRQDGRSIWVLDRGRIVERDQHGQAVRVIGSVTDVTYQVEYQHQLEHIAHYDPLTGLPNRVLLADRLHHAMSQAQRRGDTLAVAYLDLDGFKAINDQYGHGAGDRLLTTLANRMKLALREGDTLARLGGDEFVAVILDLPDIESCVPMLSRLLAAAAEVVFDLGNALRVSASLGVTFFPQADAIDADQLLRQADQAMYQAKLSGKNRYHIFDTELDRSVRGHHESLERIKQALDKREFVLFYQPKVNMRTGLVIGTEALIRWQHPERGLLPPAAFLPLIVDSLLSIEIGEWVLDTAMTQIAAWKQADLQVPVSVNIDAIQLEQADFVDRLSQQLARHPRVSPGDLELEVLETSALEDMDHVFSVMLACREMGVGFALDDFGTGYSSLVYLKRLPADMLKIDQSFVRDMLDDPDDLAILDGVLGLASAFRRQAIAEGVETLAHGEMLLKLGCELGQGYAIARPMPAGDIPVWLAAWHPDQSWLNQGPINRDDLPILFNWVEHRSWIAQVAGFLREECDAPPPMQHQQCQFGEWLAHNAQLRQDDRLAIKALELLHIEIHELASALISLKQRNQTDAAMAGLAELYRLRDCLLEQLLTMLGCADCLTDSKK
ncbi:MAG: EAL domain-containing protein [Rhodoferax sp.]